MQTQTTTPSSSSGSRTRTAADDEMYARNSLMIPPSRSLAVYNKALEYSAQASRAMWKHLLIVIGIMLYIAFVVLSTVFYYPSYYACMARSGTLWSIANAVVHAIFMVFLVCYVVRQFFEADPSEPASSAMLPESALHQFIQGFDHILPYVLSFCVAYLVISYGILFFRCRDDPTGCAGCTPTQATTFNSLVTTQVNRSNPQLKVLLDFYTDFAKTRVGISTCSNYYSDAYLTIQQNSTGTAQCGAASSNDTNAAAITDNFIMQASQSRVNPERVNGAPLLNQFYVMTSGRTCVVGDQYDGYVSPAMIRIALIGGARCLDFEVTNHSLTEKSFPVVTNSRNRDNRNLQHNFVLFEDVMRTILSEWVEPHQNMEYPADPLFLRLVLDNALTQNSMDQMAYLIQYYLNEQAGSCLLPDVFNYKALAATNSNLGQLPLPYFYGQVAILVYSPCPNTTKQFEASMLAEVTNALCTTSAATQQKTSTPFPDDTGAFQVLEAAYVQSITPTTKQAVAAASSTSAYQTLIDTNKDALTYVDTSFSPYSDVNTSPGTGCDAPDATGAGDSLTTLLMNKLTINNSPVPSIRTGCQFIAMNFQDIDEEMKTYLSVFKNASFILKQPPLWNSNDFGDAPPPVDSCLPGMTAYTNNANPRYCYQFCLDKSQTWDAATAMTGAGMANQTLSDVPFLPLTSSNNAQNSCMQAGYTYVPGVQITAQVKQTVGGKTTPTTIEGKVYAKSRQPV